MIFYLISILLFSLIVFIKPVDYYLLVNDECNNKLHTMFTLTEMEEFRDSRSFFILNCQRFNLEKDNNPICSLIDYENYPVLLAFSENKYYKYKSLLENQYELINLVSLEDLRYFGLLDISYSNIRDLEYITYLTLIQLWLIARLIVYITIG